MGAVVPILGIGMQILGGINQANQQRQQAEATSQYNNYQADQLELQAASVLELGKKQMTDLRTQVGRVDAAQKTMMSANGVGIDSVTAEDVARDTAIRGRLDELAIRYNADMEAWRLKSQAKGYRMAGSNAVAAGNAAAGGTLISTAAGVADSWYRWNQTSKGA